MAGLASETWAVFGRWIRKTIRRPPFLFFSLVQPIIWFVLFTQAFGSITNIRTPIPGTNPPRFLTFADYSGTSNYITFFSAAVVIQTVITSAMQSGMGIVTDIESGYLDKMRVAPIHRSAILLGKGLSDAVRMIIQVLVILAIGFALGVTIATGIPGLLLLLLIAAGFGLAWSGISNAIALATKNSEMTLMISLITTFPLLFLSSAMMPQALLPSAVQTVAMYNPITYLANGLHSIIISGYDWTALGYTALTIVVVGAITVTAATAMFRRATAG